MFKDIDTTIPHQEFPEFKHVYTELTKQYKDPATTAEEKKQITDTIISQLKNT